MPGQIDYAALAKQHRGAAGKVAPATVPSAAPTASAQPDYAALAKEVTATAPAAPTPAAEQRPEIPWRGDTLQYKLGEVLIQGLIGAAKGAGTTAANLGDWASKIPAVGPALTGLGNELGGAYAGVMHDTTAAPVTPEQAARFAADATTPTNTAQSVGKGIEQVAEYFVPAARAEKVASGVAANIPKYLRLFPHMAAQAATGAAVATAQGGDPTTALVSGAVTPVVGAGGNRVLQWAGERAAPLVRAAIKPTVTAMKRVAGASQTGIDAQAEKLVQFILTNKITDAEGARKILQNAEWELQRVLSVKNAPTDAPQRALRYLQALERSAGKQGLPAGDVATIRNAMGELLESGMGEDVITMVPTPHPTLVGPNGKPITVLMPQTSRALRTDVSAKEALDSARSSSRWSTRKAWGEQKGAETEAGKAVERAQRDAVKAAVPEARPLLQQEGEAIRAAEVLDRMAFRAANRDAVSLPAHVVAAGEMASGRVPIVAFAANWLRNNQLKAGMWADALRRGIARNDVKTVGTALERLGIAVPPEVSRQR